MPRKWALCISLNSEKKPTITTRGPIIYTHVWPCLMYRFWRRDSPCVTKSHQILRINISMHYRFWEYYCLPIFHINHAPLVLKNPGYTLCNKTTRDFPYVTKRVPPTPIPSSVVLATGSAPTSPTPRTDPRPPPPGPSPARLTASHPPRARSPTLPGAYRRVYL